MDDKLIRFYTELIFVHDTPQKADVIFVPGSQEMALGEKAAYKCGIYFRAKQN